MFKELNDELKELTKKFEFYKKEGFFEGHEKDLKECKRNLIIAETEMNGMYDHRIHYKKAIANVNYFLNKDYKRKE